MENLARVLAVATAVPPYELDQSGVTARVKAQFGHHALVERLLPVFANTGIERRYSSVPIEWYYGEHGWRDRNQTYLESALALLERVTLEVLARAHLTTTDVDAIVVVSTTGIATPSLCALLMARLPLRPSVLRLPIFGLGCAGGVLGFARAASVAVSQPGARVLLLVVELCALSFRRDDFSKSNIVATALFGDGAAAALLCTQGEGPAATAWGEHTFPDTLDVMGWDVTENGLKAIFSRDIPQLIEEQMTAVTGEYLARSGLTLRDIDAFICHPGGAKVLDALENAFGTERGALADSRAVLREFGNMSAATALFVLERSLARNQPWRRALLSAMGPGFTAGFVTLER